MRTKTLIITAALGLIGAATSMAQVYSLNAVGYVNVTIPNGFSIISNPLLNSDNSITNLLSVAPSGTIVYKFNNSTGLYNQTTRVGANWIPNTTTLVPGEGLFVKNSTGTNWVVTFVGEVVQGAQTNAIPTGFSLKGSLWPADGTATTLGVPKTTPGDKLYKFNNGTGLYNQSTVVGTPGVATNPIVPEPSLTVGSGFFFFHSGPAVNWTQNFSVNG